jgi:hypothetical protein
VRAILFGGPVDKNVMDVPENTEYVNIPAIRGDMRYARYARVGEEFDKKGRYARFDFNAVYPGLPQE